MLIVFPLGLLTVAAIFDILYIRTGNPRWGDRSFWVIVAGLIGGAAAALFGTIDFLGIPADTRARRIGLLHGIGNAIVLGLFLLSWQLRRADPANPPLAASLLAFLGVGLSVITGWLGGELVDRLGVAVHEGAHVNAPNSLSGRPASESAPPRRVGGAGSIPGRDAGTSESVRRAASHDASPVRGPGADRRTP
jgi:uncharacterized membrane protein